MSDEPRSAGAVDIACTLEAGDLRARVAAWADVLSSSTERTRLADGGLRIALAEDADVAALASIVAAEQRCCAFFAFAITVDDRGLGLEVRAPSEAAPIVAELFGAADEPEP